ncbi:MAG TPA: hypothetical protein QF646_07595 [Candidatus Poseidoniales archaeon]|nr:hypothetical protein [Candidatus Poseidoniales archaeon]
MSKEHGDPQMWSAMGGECTIEEPFSSEHGGMFVGFSSTTSTGQWPKEEGITIHSDSRWFHAYAFGTTIQEIPLEPPSSFDKWMMKSVRRIRGGPSLEWTSCWQHLDEERLLNARARSKDLAKAIGSERRDHVVDLIRHDWAEQKRCAGNLRIHGIIDLAIEQGILRAARHQPWEEGCLLVFLGTQDDGEFTSVLAELDSLVIEHI